MEDILVIGSSILGMAFIIATTFMAFFVGIRYERRRQRKNLLNKSKDTET